jgi:hypothetical protein
MSFLIGPFSHRGTNAGGAARVNRSARKDRKVRRCGYRDDLIGGTNHDFVLWSSSWPIPSTKCSVWVAKGWSNDVVGVTGGV